MSTASPLSEMAWTPPYHLKDDFPLLEQLSLCIEDGRVYIAFYSCYLPKEFLIDVWVQEGEGWRHVWERHGKGEGADAEWKRVLRSKVTKLMVVDVL